MLDQALAHATSGLRVFPLQPDKKIPRKNSRGVLDATADPRVVADWFSGPADLNFGVACGAYPDGWYLLVVDVDVKSGGMESYTKLALDRADEGGFGSTYTVQTAGGGWHHYYWSREPVYNSASKIAPGIDTRGDGGYVVAPGSKIGDVYYRVSDDEPIAVIPDWLLSELRSDAEGAPSGSVSQQLPDQVIEGARNESLASIAGTMRRRNMDQEAIEVALLSHNSRHCSPPLPNDEVLAIARSIARYEPSPAAMEETLTWGGGTVVQSDAPAVDDMRVAQFLYEDPPEVEMLVEGLLPARVVGLIAGAGGVGKTTIITEMAVAAAGGRCMFGHWAPVRPLKCAMLIKEDDRDDLWRMVHRAAKAPIVEPGDAFSAHGVGDRAALLKRIDENLRAFSLLGRSTVLIEQDGKRAVRAKFMSTLMDTVQRVRDDMGGLDLLFLDPLRRFSNADENDSNAANMLVEALDRIRDEFDITVLATHHIGKTKDITKNYASRGSSALEDGGRFIMNVAAINEQDELARLGLTADDGWNRYLKMVNVKNTKMRPAHQLVIERTKEMHLETVGRYADLIGSGRQGSHKAVSNYDALIPKILEILADEPGQWTPLRMSKEYGGMGGHFEVGRDTLREACEAGIEREEITLHELEYRGQKARYMAPQGWQPPEGGAHEDD